METSEFSVPHEYYVSSEQVNRVINVIQDSVLKLELPKTDEHHICEVGFKTDSPNTVVTIGDFLINHVFITINLEFGVY